MKKIMFMALMCMPFASHAISIGVKLTCTETSGIPAVAAAVLSACNDLEAQVNTKANKDLPEANISETTKGFANATAIAGVGQGTDYADKIEYASIRPNLGIGVDTRDNSISDAKSGGGAVQASVSIGVNLKHLPIEKVGPIEFKKMDLFVNYLGYDLDNKSDNLEATGSVRAMGIHARYELIEGKDWVPGYLAQWGGVHLSTGFQYSSMNITANYKVDPLKETFQDGDTIVNGDMNDGSAKIEVDSSSISIPLELSTSVRLGYVFSFYGGIGTDLNFSKADVSFKGGGTISGSGTHDPDGTGPTPAVAVGISGSASASESSDENGDKLFVRGFAGAQFNLPYFRVYGQVNKVLGKNVLGANLGMKIIW